MPAPAYVTPSTRSRLAVATSGATTSKIPDGPADASRTSPSYRGSSDDAAHAAWVATIATTAQARPARANRPGARPAAARPAAPSTMAPGVTHGRNAGYRDDSHAPHASVTAAVAGSSQARAPPTRNACQRRTIPKPASAAIGGASAATYA